MQAIDRQPALESALLLGIRTTTFLILLTPLVVTPDAIFPYIVGKALYARIFIEIGLGLWLVLAYRFPQYRPRRSPLIIVFAAYLGISLLSGLFGVSPLRSLWSTYERMQGVVDLAHWFAWTVVLVSVLKSKAEWRTLLTFNLTVSLVMALLGMAQHYDVRVIPFYEFLRANPRLDITLGNPTFVGAYMLVNILIGLGLFGRSFYTAPGGEPRTPRRRRQRRTRRGRRSESSLLPRSFRPIHLWRALWIGAVALDFWILILTGTRGALTGLVAGLSVFVAGYLLFGHLKWLKVSSAALWGLLMGMALVGIIARDTEPVKKVTANNVMLQRMSTLGLDDGSVKSRLTTISIGLQGVAARPILGWGPENYLIPFGRYNDSVSGTSETLDQAHNKPLEELTTKGTLGFAAYIALWGYMFWFVYRRAKTETDPYEQIFMLLIGAALTGYFVQNFFLFDTPSTIMQFILMVALVGGLESLALGAAGSREHLPPEQVTGTSDRVGARPAPQRFVLVAIAVTVLVGGGAYFLNIRPYQGAVALVRTTDPLISWEQALGEFDESIDSFDGLANYPRFILFGNLTSNLENLSSSQAAAAMATAEEEAELAIASEPENWRIYVALGRLYQKAATTDPQYLEQARAYVERANELAPRLHGVISLNEDQTIVEKIYSDG